MEWMVDLSSLKWVEGTDCYLPMKNQSKSLSIVHKTIQWKNAPLRDEELPMSGDVTSFLPKETMKGWLKRERKF